MFTYPIIEAGAGTGSEFEEAIDALSPVAFYKFRDADFATNVQDDSGNGEHLVKQLATALRSSVPTRTTHPGGADFPAVTYDNWATQGTFYKAAANDVLSGVTAYTMIVSFRLIAAPSANFGKIFAIGNEDVAESGTDNHLLMRAHPGAPVTPHYVKHRTTSGGLIPVDWAATELLEDGVNRLMIVRYEDDVIFRMTSSKPGHKALIEESGSASSGTGLGVLSRPLILNARSQTGGGASTTLAVVADAIALIASDIGDAAEVDLHDKWTTEVAGAGYYPSMIQYDGSTDYYTDTYTSVGNKVSVTLRFNATSFTATPNAYRLFESEGPGGFRRVQISLGATDHPTPNFQDRVYLSVFNSAGSAICYLFGADGAWIDGQDHVLHFAFDGDAGTAVFRIDGTDADDTGNGSRTAPTTGTLDTGASTSVSVGADPAGVGKLVGNLGFVGMKDAYITNYSDFIDATDNTLPAAIDEKGWCEWDGRSAGDFGMTTFDGSTSYYNDTYTSSGNKVTIVCRFNRSSFTGGTLETLFRATGPSAHFRAVGYVFSSDYADSDRQDKIQVQVKNSSGTNICLLFSPTGYLDGSDHVLFFEFDGDAGTAEYRIDGTDTDDTGNADRVAPTTGTLDSGASSTFRIGADGSPTNVLDGTIGFLGMRDIGGLTHTDFSTTSTPLDIDEINWTEWGGQPEYWNRTGEMADNKGSAGNMTINGTIIPARPLFWSHTGQMDNSKGTAGDMTENGTPVFTTGGSP